MSRYLVSGDWHIPAHLDRGMEQFLDEVKRFKPDGVVLSGDIVDFYRQSRYEHNPAMPSLKDELEHARDAIARVAAVLPVADVLMGNHEYRLPKAAVRGGLSEECLRPIPELLGFPKGWRVRGRFAYVGDYKEFVVRHGATKGRGYGGKDAARRYTEKTGKSTIMGHIHQAGYAEPVPREFDFLWACATGCLIDPKHPAFDYSRDMADRPALGYIIVENSIPRWVKIDGCDLVNLTPDEMYDYTEHAAGLRQQQAETVKRTLQSVPDDSRRSNHAAIIRGIDKQILAAVGSK